jgi:tetratricopeptide (TPR) repeat protein
MKAVCLLLLNGIALFGAQGLQFTVTDAKGKGTSAVALEAGAADEDGWQAVRIAKAKTKGEAVLVWPFDALAKVPDGPEPVPAIVIQRGDEKALANRGVVAAIATPVVLGISTLEQAAAKFGYSADALTRAFADLPSATDAYQKGVGLLYAGKAADAAEQLAIALRERQRRLTRMPSDIYPAALLYGQALYRANKFDDAAVAFLTARKQRPSSELAAKARDEALIKAGKGDAVGR